MASKVSLSLKRRPSKAPTCELLSSRLKHVDPVLHEKLGQLYNYIDSLQTQLKRKDEEIQSLRIMNEHLQLSKTCRELFVSQPHVKVVRSSSVREDKPITRIRSRSGKEAAAKEAVRYQAQKPSVYLFSERTDDIHYGSLAHVREISSQLSRFEHITRVQFQSLFDSVKQMLEEHRAYFSTIQNFKTFLKFISKLSEFKSAAHTVREMEAALAQVLDCEGVAITVHSGASKSHYFFNSSGDIVEFDDKLLKKVRSRAESRLEKDQLKQLQFPFIGKQLASLMVVPVQNQHSQAFIFAYNKKGEKDFSQSDQNFLKLLVKTSIGRILVKLEENGQQNRRHYYRHLFSGLHSILARESLQDVALEVQNLVRNLFLVQKCKLLLYQEGGAFSLEGDKLVSADPKGIISQVALLRTPVLTPSAVISREYEKGHDLDSRQPFLTYPLAFKGVLVGVVQFVFSKYSDLEGHLPQPQSEALDFLAQIIWERQNLMARFPTR